MESSHKTVAIIYGFTEGKWHGKRFRKQLRIRGFHITTDPKIADIIISHSAGVMYIPKQLHPSQLVVLINPPYWPGKPLPVRARAMVKQIITTIRPGNAPIYRINKTAHNAAYLVTQAKKTQAILKQTPNFDLEAALQHQNTILFRTSQDPWLTSDLKTLQSAHPSLRIHELEGDHDACWVDPVPYISQIMLDITSCT